MNNILAIFVWWINWRCTNNRENFIYVSYFQYYTGSILLKYALYEILWPHVNIIIRWETQWIIAKEPWRTSYLTFPMHNHATMCWQYDFTFQRVRRKLKLEKRLNTNTKGTSINTQASHSIIFTQRPFLRAFTHTRYKIRPFVLVSNVKPRVILPKFGREPFTL